MVSHKLHHNSILLYKAFMSSHAVFNALTYVQHQIASNENRASLKALSTFADFIRKSSDDVELSHRNIQKEFDMLKAYCVLEQWRFSELLNIKVQKDFDTDKDVPGFLFAPFTEQAILAVLKAKESNIEK